MRKSWLHAAVAMTLWAGEAHAHARLIHAEPRVGATVAQPPAELRLTFSEIIEPGQSSVTLTGPGGAVTLGRLRLDIKNPHVAVVRVAAPLGPGAYRVEWSMVSADSHHTDGDFRFRVRPEAIPQP